MFLVLSQTLASPPPAAHLPALTARPSGVYSAALLTKLIPFRRPLPRAPTTPVFFTHSRPEWTFSPSQCDAPDALCFAQSMAAPALCFAQSTAAPALCCTQLAPLCRALNPPRATFERACAPCLMFPQALWPTPLAAFQRPCALLEMQPLAEWNACEP